MPELLMPPTLLSQLVGRPAGSRIAFSNHLLALGYNSDGGGTASGSNTTSLSRVAFGHPSIDVCSIQVAFANWKLQGGAAEAPGANPILVTGSVEYPLGTIMAQLTFGGATAVTIAPGATVWSDTLPIYVRAGQRGYIRTFLSVPGGSGSWPRGFPPIAALGEASQEGVGLADNTMSGSSGYSGANGGCFAPVAIVGTLLSPNPSVLLLGDSLSWGQGDDATGLSSSPTGDGLGNYGPFQRALYAAGIGHNKMVRSGLYARDSTGSSFRHRPFAAGAGTAVVLLGTNDLSGGLSAAQLQSSLLEIWAALAAQGCRVLVCTIPPHTNSTDTWATTTNQSPVNASYSAGSGSARGQINAFIRAAPASGRGVFGVIDVSDAVETQRDSGLWRTGFTNDGTHWNAAKGIPAVQAVVSAAIASGLFI